MRINKFVAVASGLSRRAADAAVEQGRVFVDRQQATVGQEINDAQKVTLDGRPLSKPGSYKTIILYKSAGFVVSRNGQGSKTVYDLLPAELHNLKPVGRLDKDSSGLLLLTNDGGLANELTHPRFAKTKIYEVTLGQPLSPQDEQRIASSGVTLEDGTSRLQLKLLNDGRHTWEIAMREGRNRQIRRTFAALGYEVTRLHRTHFGNYELGSLQAGHYRTIQN